jgi:hypothetical protein
MSSFCTRLSYSVALLLCYFAALLLCCFAILLLRLRIDSMAPEQARFRSVIRGWLTIAKLTGPSCEEAVKTVSAYVQKARY